MLVLVLVIVLAVYHLTAVLDAFRLGTSPGAARRIRGCRAVGRSARRSSLVALAGVIAFYGVIEFVGVRAYQASQAIFVDPSSGFEIPAASFAPTAHARPRASSRPAR